MVIINLIGGSCGCIIESIQSAAGRSGSVDSKEQVFDEEINKSRLVERATMVPLCHLRVSYLSSFMAFQHERNARPIIVLTHSSSDSLFFLSIAFFFILCSRAPSS